MDNEYLIFSNKMADIYFEPKIKMMTIIYRGLVDYELFEDIIRIVNTTAIATGIIGVVADVTELRGSYHKVLGYMENTGFPLLVENGLRVQAQIISDDIIMQNLSEKVGEIMKSLGINFTTFTNRKDGEKWLLKELAKSSYI